MANKIVILKYVYYGITIVSLVVIAISIKYLLGGYEPLKVESIGPSEFTVAGSMFEGKENSTAHQESIATIQNYIEAGKLKGEFTVIHYPQADAQAGYQQFIGAVLTGNVFTFPSSLQIKEYETPDALGLEVEMHPLFRPSVDEIKKLMVDFYPNEDISANPIVEINKSDSHKVGWYMPLP